MTDLDALADGLDAGTIVRPRVIPPAASIPEYDEHECPYECDGECW